MPPGRRRHRNDDDSSVNIDKSSLDSGAPGQQLQQQVLCRKGVAAERTRQQADGRRPQRWDLRKKRTVFALAHDVR